jgi:hypothetical protein
MGPGLTQTGIKRVMDMKMGIQCARTCGCLILVVISICREKHRMMLIRGIESDYEYEAMCIEPDINTKIS